MKDKKLRKFLWTYLGITEHQKELKSILPSPHTKLTELEKRMKFQEHAFATFLQQLHRMKELLRQGGYIKAYVKNPQKQTKKGKQNATRTQT